MTGLLDALLAAIVAGLLNLVVLYQIRLRATPTETTFLTRIYLGTVLLRYALAVGLNLAAADSGLATAFWGDSGSYDTGGHQLAMKWSGEPTSSVYLSTAVSGYGWVHFVGSIYYIFGRNQLLIQLVNGLIGGLTVLLIYAIAARLFDRPAARWAAFFMAFFPQMVFWSTGMYKDPATLLCIAIAMYAVLDLRDHFSASTIAMFVAAVVGLVGLRFYIAYFVLFAAVAAFVFGQRRGAARLAITYALLVVALFGALNLAVKRETLERQATYLTFERLQTTREDQATWGQSGFGREYDVSTPAGAIRALPTGLAYLLFAPFPWAISGLRQALTLPETLVWYALMPAFVRGMASAIRTRLRATLPILVFMVTLTAAYALMQGNVGTAYRQRTQITMFFFIFMGAGVVERARHRSRAESQGAALPPLRVP